MNFPLICVMGVLFLHLVVMVCFGIQINGLFAMLFPWVRNCILSCSFWILTLQTRGNLHWDTLAVSTMTLERRNLAKFGNASVTSSSWVVARQSPCHQEICWSTERAGTPLVPFQDCWDPAKEGGGLIWAAWWKPTNISGFQISCAVVLWYRHIALIRLPPKRRQTIMLQEKSSSISMSRLKEMEAMGRFVLCALVATDWLQKLTFGPQPFPAVEESALMLKTYYCSDSRLLVFPDNTFYILLSGLIIEPCWNIYLI